MSMIQLTRLEVIAIIEALDYAQDEFQGAEDNGFCLTTGADELVRDAKIILVEAARKASNAKS